MIVHKREVIETLLSFNQIKGEKVLDSFDCVAFYTALSVFMLHALVNNVSYNNNSNNVAE